MRAMISTDEPARSVSGAEALQARHSELKAEIDAREDSMAQVNKAGRKLTQQGHYASTEVRMNSRKTNRSYGDGGHCFIASFHVQIRDRMSDLKREGASLQQVWLDQKHKLDQMLEFQIFLRDAKNVDAMSSAHEVAIHKCTCMYVQGTYVDQNSMVLGFTHYACFATSSLPLCVLNQRAQ